MNSKLYRTSFIVLLIPILIVGCGKKTEQTAVEKTTAPSADVKKMMEEHDDLKKACMSGDFASACEQQFIISEEISGKGWCFGEEGQSEADKKWHECKKVLSEDCKKMPPTRNYGNKQDRNACYDVIMYSWAQVKNNLLDIEKTKEMVELMIEKKMVSRCNADMAAIESNDLNISPIDATMAYRDATEACMNSYK